MVNLDRTNYSGYTLKFGMVFSPLKARLVNSALFNILEYGSEIAKQTGIIFDWCIGGLVRKKGRPYSDRVGTGPR